MAPKRKVEASESSDVGDSSTATAPATRRVTRSLTRQVQNSGADSVPPVAPPPKPKKPRKAPTKTTVQESKTTASGESETITTDVGASASGAVNPPTIIIEHCKQCTRFKTRALQVQKGLVEGVPGITVVINPEKPRRGCFEIRMEGGETFISLQDMKRPFKPLTDLDMDTVISDIVGRLNA